VSDLRQLIVVSSTELIKNNPEKVNITKHKKNSLVQLPRSSLGQETRWAYSITLKHTL